MQFINFLFTKRYNTTCVSQDSIAYANAYVPCIII